MENNDILDNDLMNSDSTQKTYNLVGPGKRIANSLLDTFFYYIIFLILMIILAVIDPTFVQGLNKEYQWLNIIFSLVVFELYYIVFESTLGRTPAKYITKTKVIALDGSKPDFRTIVIRSLCRLIPFDGITFLIGEKSGWHDTLSKTKVVDARE